MTEYSQYLIILLAFGAVAAVVFVAGQYVSMYYRLQQRAGGIGGRDGSTNVLAGIHSFVSAHFDEKRFQLEGEVRAKLRRDLIKAGIFRADAVNYYIFARLALVVVLPLIAYLMTETLMVGQDWPLKLFIVVVAMLIGMLGPDAYIARRQRLLAGDYRIVFPDLLDLMVVCVDAGLSLEATFDRLSPEVMKRSRELGMNMIILGSEMRAGRTLSDALESFAERLGLDEARSFVSMLRQSIELGTDVGTALRVYSDEMRDRRLMRAEERANQLPVKMVLPLGLFIFPVILATVMIPVILRLMSALK